MADVHITIIGGGIVGLAIASRLSERRKNIVLLEKNERYGMETSSRNSEVIHAGIYYPPGSLKARLCVEGRDELYLLCQRHELPHRRITKLITAAENDELGRLEKIFENGRANGVELELIDAAGARMMEPNIRTVGAIFSPMSGILSAHAVMDHLYNTSISRGVVVQHRCEVTGIQKKGDEYALEISENGEASAFTSEVVINSAGLNADKIASMIGIDIDEAGYRQHLCKGSYFSVSPTKGKLISRLIYPVPPPDSLGVHALIDMGGRVKFGPDVEYLPDGKCDYAVSESRKKEFAAAISKIVPAISAEDISPDMSGIRPKLQRKGEPARDFIIVHETDRGLRGFINLVGIDSPGLTSSPAIARYVEEML